MRLDVVVHDAGSVRGDQRRADLPRDSERAARVQRFPLPNVLAEIGALDPLHHQEPQVPVDPPVVQGDHVRMVDLRGSHRLAFEPARQIRVHRPVQDQHLDRHVPAQHPVPPRPHLAHPATAEPFQQLVTSCDQFSAFHPPPPMTTAIPANRVRLTARSRRDLGNHSGMASFARQAPESATWS
ncbi:hypothetical protein GCM10009647_035810 [Streptomyces sanglieri]